MFSEQEIKFLIQPHRIETADRNGKHAISAAVDLRTLGCPTPIFNRVLESRAKKLGNKFQEFRNQQRLDQTTVPATDLDVQIAASRPF